MKNKDSILMALKCIGGYYEGPACKDCLYLKETEPNVHSCDGEQILIDAVKLIEKLGKIQDKIVQCEDCVYFCSPDGYYEYCKHLNKFVSGGWFCGDGIEVKRENGN